MSFVGVPVVSSGFSRQWHHKRASQEIPGDKAKVSFPMQGLTATGPPSRPAPCGMENYALIRKFCEPLSIAPRCRTVTAMWPDGRAETYRLHCFADQEDALAFIDEFGGVHFDPKRDRGKGKLRSRWVRSDEWQPVTRSGPLRVPTVLIGKPAR